MFHVEPSEYDECCAYWDWIQLNPLLRDYTVHFANESKRSPQYAKKLKRIGGLPKGFPDYQIMLANKKYHSLYIEMKTKDERNKKQKKEQIMWINRLLKAGHYATFGYGFDDAVQITWKYLNNIL